MYKGENPIAIESMNWFAQALLRLMKTMGYKDIIVRMLCKEADLSRHTFYNLFKDKDEVLLYYLESSAKEYFDETNFCGEIKVHNFVESFSNYIDTHENLLRIIAENHMEFLLHQAIANEINEVASLHAKTYKNPYGAAFLSGALTQIIIFWIYDENRISVEELTDIIEQIMMGKHYKIEQ
ncbi:MAG: TetR/AcrR family transcriptional regulator [Anaerostipes sp.]|nr:TetR/AcrR family transcriptional regulator [Anaerostipes sp.]